MFIFKIWRCVYGIDYLIELAKLLSPWSASAQFVLILYFSSYPGVRALYMP